MKYRDKQMKAGLKFCKCEKCGELYVDGKLCKCEKEKAYRNRKQKVDK